MKCERDDPGAYTAKSSTYREDATPTRREDTMPLIATKHKVVLRTLP